MGAWGYGLFQSDADLDIMDEIQADVNKLAESKHGKIKEENYALWHPEHPATVTRKLQEDNVLDELFKQYTGLKWNYGSLYLGALAMQLGVYITDDQRTFLTKLCKSTDNYKESKAQYAGGLAKYVNGTPYDFKSPGLHETMMTTEPSAEIGHMGFNVQEDWGLRFAKIKPEPEKEMKMQAGGDNENKKPEHPKKATGKDALGDKAKLKEWFG